MKKKTLTVAEIFTRYSNQHLGQIVRACDMIDDIVWEYGVDKALVQPSNFVVNPPADRVTNVSNSHRLFVRLERGMYYCIGDNPSFKDKMRFLFNR